MKINHTFRPRQNKPNQTQFVVCPPDAQMDVNLVKTRDCNNEQRTMNYELLCKTNPTCRGVASGEAGSNPILSALGGLVRLRRIQKGYLTALHSFAPAIARRATAGRQGVSSQRELARSFSIWAALPANKFSFSSAGLSHGSAL